METTKEIEYLQEKLSGKKYKDFGEIVLVEGCNNPCLWIYSEYPTVYVIWEGTDKISATMYPGYRKVIGKKKLKKLSPETIHELFTFVKTVEDGTKRD